MSGRSRPILSRCESFHRMFPLSIKENGSEEKFGDFSFDAILERAAFLLFSILTLRYRARPYASSLTDMHQLRS